MADRASRARRRGRAGRGRDGAGAFVDRTVAGRRHERHTRDHGNDRSPGVHRGPNGRRHADHLPQRPATPTVPPGWTTFSNPTGGYTVAYPPGWSRSTGLARHGTAFRDGTGRSVKVESAHPAQVPASGDPLPGWIQNERYWSARLPGYRLIGSVHRGTYHEMRAAIWEYTSTPNGRPTHGLDISFVVPTAAGAIRCSPSSQRTVGSRPSHSSARSSRHSPYMPSRPCELGILMDLGRCCRDRSRV
jgi:hypothetical protein